MLFSLLSFIVCLGLGWFISVSSSCECRVIPVACSAWHSCAGQGGLVPFRPSPSQARGGWGPGEFCSQCIVYLGETRFPSSAVVCLCTGPCLCCSHWYLSAPGSESVSPDSLTRCLHGAGGGVCSCPGTCSQERAVRSRERCCFPSKAV